MIRASVSQSVTVYFQLFILHNCMYFSVTLKNGGRYPLVLHLEIILRIPQGADNFGNEREMLASACSCYFGWFKLVIDSYFAASYANLTKSAMDDVLLDLQSCEMLRRKQQNGAARCNRIRCEGSLSLFVYGNWQTCLLYTSDAADE